MKIYLIDELIKSFLLKVAAFLSDLKIGMKIWGLKVKQRQIEIFYGYGHKNIRATHKTTLELTKEESLTKKGDCIVAVNVDKGFPNLDQSFLNLCKSKDCRITVVLECEEISDEIIGFGHPNLTFQHPSDMVIRKSQFICPRTLMIGANKAAQNLNKQLISKLQDSRAKVQIKLIAEL
jgi:hypothetical protein